MDVMGMTDEDQASVLQIVASILHIGNIAFNEIGNYAEPQDEACKLFQNLLILLRCPRNVQEPSEINKST